MSVYSFLSIQATIVGPGGNLPLANGAQAAEEGITFSMSEDKNSLTIGAGGEGMHNLHAGRSGTVSVKLLKTSPINALLTQMYNLQTANPSLHGQNTLTARDISRGDVMQATGAAFKKFPDVVYGKDGPMLDWVFDAISITPLLGSGAPTLF